MWTRGRQEAGKVRVVKEPCVVGARLPDEEAEDRAAGTEASSLMAVAGAVGLACVRVLRAVEVTTL